ncbi:hypothetical protein ACOI22_14100 [Glaciecola sp. 2405UD65-10]|uniref:hypothetical protein n=1 Tax=Glaciecola sp. 2405UD65-10 TaxID=3397244 RepID=UPI003B5ADEA8
MKQLLNKDLQAISGARDRSFRSPQFSQSSGWSSGACNNLSNFNDAVGTISFASGMVPGGQAISLATGAAGMAGMALSKQFCS